MGVWGEFAKGGNIIKIHCEKFSKKLKKFKNRKINQLKRLKTGKIENKFFQKKICSAAELETDLKRIGHPHLKTVQT